MVIRRCIEGLLRDNGYDHEVFVLKWKAHGLGQTRIDRCEFESKMPWHAKNFEFILVAKKIKIRNVQAQAHSQVGQLPRAHPSANETFDEKKDKNKREWLGYLNRLEKSTMKIKIEEFTNTGNNLNIIGIMMVCICECCVFYFLRLATAIV